MTDTLIKLRHRLHGAPELSNGEEQTAETITAFLEESHPDEIITDIGGHGLAAVFDSGRPGPRILVRCELDALPIPETISLPYGSSTENAAHKCGHDGHMTIVAGLGTRLAEQRPKSGAVILLFQPAEEKGQGARRVIDDKKYSELKPDYALALHNLPGFPRGSMILRRGVFASASTGLHVHLKGRTSHAAEPESGNSPALAIAELIQRFSAMPQFHAALHEAAKVTVIHARLGEVAFGTSPGEADVMATLRAHEQEVIDRLMDEAIAIAEHTAESYGLQVTTELKEPFPSTANDDDVVGMLEKAAGKVGLEVISREIPFAWSEDFGHFTAEHKGALFGLGAGEDHPVLHHPEYDFPDDLIEPGIAVFEAAIKLIQDKGDV